MKINLYYTILSYLFFCCLLTTSCKILRCCVQSQYQNLSCLYLILPTACSDLETNNPRKSLSFAPARVRIKLFSVPVTVAIVLLLQCLRLRWFCCMFHIADEPDRIMLVIRSNNGRTMLLLRTEYRSKLVEEKDSERKCCGLIVTWKTWATWVFRVWDVFWKAVRFCRLRCHSMPANSLPRHIHCWLYLYVVAGLSDRSDVFQTYSSNHKVDVNSSSLWARYVVQVLWFWSDLLKSIDHKRYFEYISTDPRRMIPTSPYWTLKGILHSLIYS